MRDDGAVSKVGGEGAARRRRRVRSLRGGRGREASLGPLSSGPWAPRTLGAARILGAGCPFISPRRSVAFFCRTPIDPPSSQSQREAHHHHSDLLRGDKYARAQPWRNRVELIDRVPHTCFSTAAAALRVLPVLATHHLAAGTVA